MHIDINCDMGEGMGNDEAIMPYITSANIASGYHAARRSASLSDQWRSMPHSRTMRTARSRTSGENLFVVLLMMLHPTQELEPPANPGRFTALWGHHRCGRKTGVCSGFARRSPVEFF